MVAVGNLKMLFMHAHGTDVRVHGLTLRPWQPSRSYLILSVSARSEMVTLEGQKSRGLKWCGDHFRL